MDFTPDWCLQLVHFETLTDLLYFDSFIVTLTDSLNPHAGQFTFWVKSVAMCFSV